MKKSALYRLEIAPLVILPLVRSPFFSYLSAVPVTAGSSVKIPFGKQTLEGVVFGCAPLPGRAPSWMKYVGEILEPDFLTAEQLQLAEYIAEEYFTPLGKTLRHFLPRRAKARKKNVSSPAQKRETLRPTKEEAKILKDVAALERETPGYIDTSSLNHPHRLFAHLAKKIAVEKQQALFLVPEMTLLPEWEALFLRCISQEKIVVLSSQLADGPYFEAWEKIKSGEVNIILATRQGLFAPFKNLKLVTLLEEQDESYKQWDMSPRYDGKRVSGELALLHHAKLLLTSGTPSIESRYRLKKQQYVPLVPPQKTAPLGPLLEMVNLRLERYKKNYSPLSQALTLAIRTALSEKKQILLYIHRQGMSAFSVCEHCKNIIRCPDSGHALSANKDGTFRCLFCAYKTGSFPSCPSCGHLGFRHIGFGTERVEREAERLFPSARIFRADGSTMRAPGSVQRLFEQVSQGAVDILIGTQMILKGPTLPKMALFGMIDADSLLAFPDFRADEKLSHILNRAIGQISHKAVKQSQSQARLREREESAPGKIFIQTFHPESAFFQRIASLDSEVFAEQLLAEREDLSYPPFSRLITLTCQGKTKEEADSKAETLERSLSLLLLEGKRKRQYRLNAPQPAKKQGMKKFFESTLVLRIPSGQPIPLDIHSFLRKNTALYSIDIDPLLLL